MNSTQKVILVNLNYLVTANCCFFMLKKCIFIAETNFKLRASSNRIKIVSPKSLFEFHIIYIKRINPFSAILKSPFYTFELLFEFDPCHTPHIYKTNFSFKKIGPKMMKKKKLFISIIFYTF